MKITSFENVSQQIQIKTSLCPGQPHAYCVCGVAVAVGRDVFVMDNCIRAPPRFRSCRDGIMNELVYHNARNDEYMVNNIHKTVFFNSVD